MAIHPTAIIHPGAELDPSADVGPYCIVGPRVKIGPGSRLLSHVVVDNDTVLGARNVVHPFASLGGAPQDLKFKGERARLLVGDDNVIREGVTLNLGTASGRMETRIGNKCLLMAYSHVAHDCVLGNGVIVANGVGLAGHVTVHDNVIMGGMVGIHQFVRIGRGAFLAGGAMVAQDVPPYCLAQGDRAKLAGLNLIGLKRAGWSRDRIAALHDAFVQLFRDTTRSRHDALELVERELAPHSADVRELCEFVRTAERGVCGGRRQGGDDEPV